MATALPAALHRWPALFKYDGQRAPGSGTGLARVPTAWVYAVSALSQRDEWQVSLVSTPFHLTQMFTQ